MKAVVITQPGGPEVLQMQEREMPKPQPTEVLIKVHAAGINRPDVMQRQGKYPPPPGAPQDIPGLEVAGEIVETGSAVLNWKPGDRVCALLTGGGYAEYAIAQTGHCLPIPENLSFAEAASLPETIFTVWHNVFQRGALKAGENFLVHGGSSGIGITAIQLAKAFGARVFATAGSDEKCKTCEQLGAAKCINYKNEDFEQVLENECIDVILDMIGGDYIAKNIRLLRPEGRLVFINTMKGGKAKNESEQVDFSLIMRNRLTVTGSTLRNRDIEFKTLLALEIRNNVWPLIENGAFRPMVFREFPFEKAAEAHELMESSSHIGKIMLVNSP